MSTRQFQTTMLIKSFFPEESHKLHIILPVPEGKDSASMALDNANFVDKISNVYDEWLRKEESEGGSAA